MADPAGGRRRNPHPSFPSSTDQNQGGAPDSTHAYHNYDYSNDSWGEISAATQPYNFANQMDPFGRQWLNDREAEQQDEAPSSLRGVATDVDYPFTSQSGQAARSQYALPSLQFGAMPRTWNSTAAQMAFEDRLQPLDSTPLFEAAVTTHWGAESKPQPPASTSIPSQDALTLAGSTSTQAPVQTARRVTRRRNNAPVKNQVAPYTFSGNFRSAQDALALVNALRRVKTLGEDDYEVVEANFAGHSEDMFKALTSPHAPWPTNYDEAQRDFYEKGQYNAANKIAGRMSTEELCESAEAWAAATVGAVIEVHKVGIPKRLFSKTSLQPEEDMKCSERMSYVLKAVTENKFAAEAVVNGEFADLVRSPKEYLQRKLDNARSNGTKKRKNEVANTIEETQQAQPSRKKKIPTGSKQAKSRARGHPTPDSDHYSPMPTSEYNYLAQRVEPLAALGAHQLDNEEKATQLPR